MGCIRKYDLPRTWRQSNNIPILPGNAPIREDSVSDLGGLPTGEKKIGSQVKEPTPVDTVLLNCSPAARQAAMTPSSCSNSRCATSRTRQMQEVLICQK